MSHPSVVFIHGNFVTRRCWDNWVARYEARGLSCLAIEYPLRDGSVEELRAKHPDPALGRLGLPEVLEHHVRILSALPEKPIVIGHSFGGFLTQLVVQRGLAAAAVAIDSVPVLGVVTTRWSFIRSLWPVINPLIPATRPYLMSFEEYQYTFVHTQPLAEQRASYDRHVVPESRTLGRAALTPLGKVDFAKERAPLLLIAGEKDHIMPASLNRSNFERYKASPSITAFKEFPNRTHNIIDQPGWEEVADFALEWAQAHAKTAREPALAGG